MNRQELTCSACEAEFYIETSEPVEFCPACGEPLIEDLGGEFEMED